MSIMNGANLVAQGRWAGSASSTTKGCTLAQGSGNGNYILTLDAGLAANECVLQITPETAGAVPSYVNTSNTKKTITMGGAADGNALNVANANFSVSVYQLPNT